MLVYPSQQIISLTINRVSKILNYTEHIQKVINASRRHQNVTVLKSFHKNKVLNMLPVVGHPINCCLTLNRQQQFNDAR